LKTILKAICLSLLASSAYSHGDVTPQPVNTESLPEVGEEWLFENPYRDAGKDVWQTAITIGSSGYSQNCARCHGLGVVSGGIAPDLRYLEAEEYGDEWFVERFQHGYTQNGITKMPAFGELLGQKAAWAIRTYIETRPADGAMDDHVERLQEVRDIVEVWVETAPADEELSALVAEMSEIYLSIGTESGAPVADSVAFRVHDTLAAETPDFQTAYETLKIGVPARR